MDNCCHNKQGVLETAAHRHRRVLWWVLSFNLVMFVVEIYFGVISNSLALVGDSLDMLGDAVTYGSSILAVGAPVVKKAKVARLKAWIMLVFGLIISIRCIFKTIYPEVPDFEVMLSVGLSALVVNLICLALLTTHREDDINMRSVWICSRNDIIANSSVLAAAGAVYFFNSSIPDLVVGIGLTALFTRSAFGIFRDVRSTMSSTS